MKTFFRLLFALALLPSTLVAAPRQADSQPQAAARLPGAVQLERMTARFVPTPVAVDLSALSEGDRKALGKLIEASKVIHELFLEQLWRGNRALFASLQGAEDRLGKARLDYYRINSGPWSELDGYKAFLPEVPARKPLGAGYYPEDLSRREFDLWFSKLPKERQERARSFYTVIRREQEGGALKIVPYDEEYRPQLERAADLLREAAALTDNPSLESFLTRRAAAFLSNDYYESELAWMELDAPVDVTVGPYETYADELFGFKAAFEAYVSLRDEKESSRLAVLSKHLQEIENNLPVAPEYRNAKLGALSPIKVVNELFCSGDAAHGVQAAAYNLPNDERVVQQKGSKRVMLKNVQQAKFGAILQPIAARVLSADERPRVSFEAFFMHILAHELAHGLGLHRIQVDDRKTTVRKELAELYSAIEEAKADVLGLFVVQYLLDHQQRLGLQGLFGPDAERELYTTFLASSFRTLRFGIEEAHGKSMAVQLNFLLDQKAVRARKDGTFTVDLPRIKAAVPLLARKLLMIEVTGNRAAAKKLLEEQGVLRPEVTAALERLGGIPTDIRPIFVTAEELLGEQRAKAAP